MRVWCHACGHEEDVSEEIVEEKCFEHLSDIVLTFRLHAAVELGIKYQDIKEGKYASQCSSVKTSQES